MRKTGYGLSAIKKIASQFNKTLILSYSKPQALEILNYLNNKGVNSILYKSINDEVNFKNKESIKCLIVANRYNGLDFPSKICNTCIITNLPIIMTPQDSFCFNVLEDINETHEKTANRIIQGVGRCNRELSDKSIYFILDDTMKTEMSRGDLLKYFPKQLIAELRLGFMDSEFGKLEDAIKIGLDFLNDKYKDYNLKIETQFKKAEKYESVQRDPHFRLEIEAWHYLINNNFENAVSIFEKLLSKYDDTKSGLIKKAWFYYLAAFCYYKLFESIKDEKYKDLYEEKLRICSNCNAHPIFNKAYTVKIQKEEKIVKEEVSEKEINLLKDWVKNPHSLFRRSWFSPEIQKFQLSIKSGLRTLANGEYESASRTFPVDIEKILKELVVNYGDASKLKFKPTFIDYINNLWSKRVIRDHIHKRGIKGDYNITRLRNLILHGKESAENLTEAVIYIMNFISFIDDLIYDTQIFRVLFNELGKIEYIPEIEKIRSFRILDPDQKVEKIIRYWAEETEQFLIFEEALETIKDIKHFRIILKITKDTDKIKIQINV